jgi:hypothetical protein
MRLLALVLTLFAFGCASESPVLPPRESARSFAIDANRYFRSSPKNRYAVVLTGRVFAAPKRPFRVSTADDVRREGISIEDPYVRNDALELSSLLEGKGFDVYLGDMGGALPADVAAVLSRIAAVSNDSSEIFFAYSGEGDRRGLRTRTLILSEGRKLCPPDTTIDPSGLISVISAIKGTHAVLLNACESGVFVDAAQRNQDFRGVVIAACAPGYATTPYEPMNLSAIYASFLGLWRDDPASVKNLATVKIEKAGGTWTNFRHKWSDFWGGGGLPISYEPVVFSNADFLL